MKVNNKVLFIKDYVLGLFVALVSEVFNDSYFVKRFN